MVLVAVTFNPAFRFIFSLQTIIVLRTIFLHTNRNLTIAHQLSPQISRVNFVILVPSGSHNGDG